MSTTGIRRLIRASAGSGKTFQLSGHFLRQLFLGHAPESILATTFTRKAAGEILGRVLLRLADGADDDTKAKQLAEWIRIPEITSRSAAELLSKLTSQLHRLRISTLDSFFQQIARSLTLELGLPPGWTIIDDHLDAKLRSQAIDAVLSQQGRDDSFNLMLMLAKGRHKRSIRTLIDDTVQNYHDVFRQTSADAWNCIPEGRRVSQRERDEAVRDLLNATLPNNQWTKARDADVARFAAQDWEGFLNGGIAKAVFTETMTYYKRPVEVGLASAYAPLIAHASTELLDRTRAQLRGIRNLLERFDREYQRLLSEHGGLRFGDVTRLLARDATETNGDRLNFRLDGSTRDLLLDEFQDTSPDQWQILKRLTESLEQHRDSSFFCVGDGKQAIYGWRGGEAEILDAVEEAVSGISPESLNQSRRSSPVIMDTVNSIFRGLPQHANLGNSQAAIVEFSQQFPNHSTALERQAGHVVLRTGPDFKASTSDAKGAAHADKSSDKSADKEVDSDSDDAPESGDWFRWAAAQICELHRARPDVEIGVLTRRKLLVARLVHELTLLNVAASEEGGTPPTDSATVLAVMSLLTLASHPSCEISRFHVAMSPLGKVVGLTDYVSDRQAQNVAEAIRARLVDDGYGATLQSWADAIGDAVNERDRIRLQQVVAEGWSFDAAGSLNPATFVELLSLARFERSRHAAVRVMTIHQSKGLEFDVVVLPELDQALFRTPQFAVGVPAPGEAPDRVCVWLSEKLRPLLPLEVREIFDQTRTRHVIESLCVLYVALTRARQALHMLIPPLAAMKSLPASYAGLLVASLSDLTSAVPNATLFESGDPDWLPVAERSVDPSVATQSAAKSHERLRLAPMADGRRRGLQRRSPSQHHPQKLYLSSATIEQLPVGKSKSKKKTDATAETQRPIDPRLRGTLMHAWFELIEWLDARMPDTTALRDVGRKQTIPEDIVEALIPEFQTACEVPCIRSVFDADTVRTELEQHNRDVRLTVHRERPFALLDGNDLVLGTIDRLVIARRGSQAVAADIVDFKTDRLVGDRDKWIQGRIENYAAQLAEYQSAVAHCFGVPTENIKKRLVLIEAAEVVTLG